MSSPEQGNKTLVISLKPRLYFLVGEGLGGVRGERDQKINVQLYYFYFVGSWLKCLKWVDLIKFFIPTNPWWVIGITRVRDWFNSLKRKWNFQMRCKQKKPLYDGEWKSSRTTLKIPVNYLCPQM